MDGKIKVFPILLSAFVTLVLTGLFNVLLIFFFGNEAKIEFISARTIDGKYETIISIKNLKKSEYLKEFEILFNNNKEIETIVKDGEIIKIDSNIIIDEISPDQVSIINILSKKDIDEKDISIIKNNQVMELENFNNYTDYKPHYFWLIVLYAIINAGFMFFYLRKARKIADETQKQIDNYKEELDKDEEKIEVIKKHIKSNKVMYLKELGDLHKQVEFYQKLLLKKYDNKLSKEELNQMIIKELKVFNKKTTKFLSYNDMYDIVNEIISEYDNKTEI